MSYNLCPTKTDSISMMTLHLSLLSTERTFCSTKNWLYIWDALYIMFIHYQVEYPQPLLTTCDVYSANKNDSTKTRNTLEYKLFTSPSRSEHRRHGHQYSSWTPCSFGRPFCPLCKCSTWGPRLQRNQSYFQVIGCCSFTHSFARRSPK